MRSVDPVLAAAITAGERQVTARVSMDWDKDGYGTPGSIDDLSRYVTSVAVQHDLTGEVPDEVSVVEGSAASSATIGLAGGPVDDDRHGAAWTFSRLNTASPFAGKERLARPALVELGFKTTGSMLYIPMLTGRSRGLDVDSGAQTATLDLLDMREALRSKVQLPAIAADAPEVSGQSVMKYGLEATWLVTYILYQNGIYVAPPPRAACRYYAPMAGSAYPFIGAVSAPKPGGYSASTAAQEAYFSVVEGSDIVKQAVEFETGPFLLGSARRADAGLSLDAPLAPGAAMATSGGRAWGRLELYFKCSTFNNGQVSAFTFRVGDTDPVAVDPYLDINILGTSSTTGTLRLRDATGTIASGPTVTASSDWQFVGVYWDLSGSGNVRFRYNGVTTSVTPTGTGPIWWVPETVPFVRTTAVANSALAEIHVTAQPNSFDAWLDQSPHVPFTAGAVVDRSVQRLDGVVAATGLDSWDLLKELAGAELALSYFDELGIYQHRTADRLASTASQTVQRTLTADADITSLGYSDQIDHVRNVVTTTASNVRVVQGAEIYASDTKILVPRRSSVTIQIPLEASILIVDDLAYDARLSASGGGSNYKSKVTNVVDVVGLDRIQVTFANSDYRNLYLVNSAGEPNLVITGTIIEDAGAGAEFTATDQVSVDEFGEQPLSVTANRWRQRDADAAGIAARLAAELAWPRPTLTDIGIVGDPRLERSDRVSVVDRDGIAVDGAYWLTNIATSWSADAGCTQVVSARRARTTALWDTLGTWDDPDYMWGA